MATSAAAGTPLVTVIGDMVEHRGPFCVAHGMIDAGRKVHDRRANVDAFGAGCDVAHGYLGGGHVAVFGQRVMFAEPHVLPVEFVGVNGITEFAHEHFVFARGIVSGGTGDISVHEQPEFHVASWVR